MAVKYEIKGSIIDYTDFLYRRKCSFSQRCLPTRPSIALRVSNSAPIDTPIKPANLCRQLNFKQLVEVIALVIIIGKAGSRGSIFDSKRNKEIKK